MQLTLDNGRTVAIGYMTAREDYLRDWLRKNAPHVPKNWGSLFGTMPLSDLIDAVDTQLPPGFGYFSLDGGYGVWALDIALWMNVRGGIPDDIKEPERTRIAQGVYGNLYGRFASR